MKKKPAKRKRAKPSAARVVHTRTWISVPLQTQPAAAPRTPWLVCLDGPDGKRRVLARFASETLAKAGMLGASEVNRMRGGASPVYVVEEA